MKPTQSSTNVITLNQSKLEQSPKQQKKESTNLVLKLKPKPRVTWTEDTIDNQHMNKLKSNLCCIYHRPGQSSSDTCTSDDQGNALERDRHTKKQHKKKCSKYRKKNEENQEDGSEQQGKKKCCGGH